MIIADPDAFKTWLTGVLKPICEADPEALAKYVIALVKKDKSPELLHQSMINQLQVFLQEETKLFVDQLFKTLESQDYIATSQQLTAVPNSNPPNLQVNKPEMPIKAPLKQIIPVSEIASALSETLNGKGIMPSVPRGREEEKKSDKDVKNRQRSRRRSLSRNRSRSRSWDRNRRSRSRDKSRDRIDREKRDRPQRHYRFTSPAWRADDRRSASPNNRLRSRSRSPRHNYRGSGRYRNRSPPRSLSRTRSVSAERTQAKREVPLKDKPGNSTPTQPKVSEVEKIATVPSTVVQPNVEPRKRRCRDYDEEGYCMRGGMCPYDHGVDAVVLEDSALSRVLYPNGTNDILVPPPNMPHMMHPPRSSMNSEYNPQAPQMWHQRGPGFRGGHRGGMNQGPRMHLGPFSGPPQMPNIQQRELIPVPVLGNDAPTMDKYSNFNSSGNVPGYHPNEHVFKKKPFDFNRLGPRQKNNPSNCSLELKKVPPGMNNITHLNNHFSKFGKIVNIQVSYEGDPEAAIVTFSSHAEANAAYRSTEAVLNNRFIKVFWHSGSANEMPKDANLQASARSIKERLGQGNTLTSNPNKFINTTLNNLNQDKEKENTNNNQPESAISKEEKLKEIETKKEEIKAQQALAVKKKQELLAAQEKLKKTQEEKRKEAIKLTQDLRKRKQDLLEKQIAQQKLLIEKMGKCPAGAQRDLLLQTIKKSQESIEVIRKDLAQAVQAMKTTVAPVAAVAVVKRSKEAMQKELLDAELDLISKQAEGIDTSDLQKKLWDLKTKAVGSTAPPVALRGRGRARRFNPVARHKLVKNNLTDNKTSQKTTFQTHAVDHRPTRLLVSGYEADEEENVLNHFKQFGEIVDHVSDDALPSVVVNYKLRKDAEVAFNKGKNFQDRTLSITWLTQNQLQRQTSRTVLISESDEDQLINSVGLPIDGEEEAVATELSEDVLLQDDEEEEEDSESRSWRR